MRGTRTRRLDHYFIEIMLLPPVVAHTISTVADTIVGQQYRSGSPRAVARPQNFNQAHRRHTSQVTSGNQDGGSEQ